MFFPPSFCWHPHIYTYVFQLRNKRRGLVAAPVSVRRSEVDMNFGAIANMEPIGSPQTKDLVCSSFFSEIGACDFFFLNSVEERRKNLLRIFFFKILLRDHYFYLFRWDVLEILSGDLRK
jgi:hypothetical protein